MKFPKEFLWGVCLIFLTATPALSSHSVTFSECQDGCPIGDQGCYSYCGSLFDPCFNHCAQLARNFIPNCIASDRQFPNTATRYTHCRDLLYVEDTKCKDYCRQIRLEVEYPNWMAEQKCPYNCQRWNPTSRSCVGAAMNGCGF